VLLMKCGILEFVRSTAGACGLGVNVGWAALRILFTALWLVPWTLACADPIPTLDEIVELHSNFKAEMRSGRVQYVLEKSCVPGLLDKLKAKKARELSRVPETTQANSRPMQRAQQDVQTGEPITDKTDSLALIEYLRRTGTYSIRLVFDRASGSAIVWTEDTRDISELLNQYGMARLVQINLSQKTVRSVVRGNYLHYMSGPNSLVSERTSTYDLDSEKILSVGLLDRRIAVSGSKWTARFTDGGRELVLEGLRDTRKLELVVDPSIGFRLKRLRGYRNKKLVAEKACEYAITEGAVFPAKYVEMEMDESGKQVSKDVYTITLAQLNVSIAPEEFEIPVPPLATFFDMRDVLKADDPDSRKRRAVRSQARRLADEVFDRMLYEYHETLQQSE